MSFDGLAIYAPTPRLSRTVPGIETTAGWAPNVNVVGPTSSPYTSLHCSQFEARACHFTYYKMFVFSHRCLTSWTPYDRDPLGPRQDHPSLLHRYDILISFTNQDPSWVAFTLLVDDCLGYIKGLDPNNLGCKHGMQEHLRTSPWAAFWVSSAPRTPSTTAAAFLNTLYSGLDEKRKRKRSGLGGSFGAPALPSGSRVVTPS
ncbi:hypothetical protein GGX14DRAFT_651295 [Mycena pura]|uniref:Uncharacterized protein n=1 Tax=Mycena pura TaxID=153505 RepID=A0AAD6YNQ8_9AGAR|nr:hypothetical protein GGX14DRAFT_651295 [Mycena pura]